MRKTNIDTQRIDGFLLETYGIVIAAYYILNKLSYFQFFQETFLLANIGIKIVLGMLFPTLNNTDVQVAKKKLIWKIYTTKKALPTTR